jgi:hypothetical protein
MKLIEEFTEATEPYYDDADPYEIILQNDKGGQVTFSMGNQQLIINYNNL